MVSSSTGVPAGDVPAVCEGGVFVGSVSEDCNPCSRSSARTRCLEDFIRIPLYIFRDDSLTVLPSKSSTQMSPRLCPIPEKNQQTGACGNCDVKVQANARDYTSKVC